MKPVYKIAILIAVIALFKVAYDELSNINEEKINISPKYGYMQEISQFENDAKTLLVILKDNFHKGNYKIVTDIYNYLKDFFPNSQEFVEAEKIKEEISKIEEENQKVKEVAEAKRKEAIKSALHKLKIEKDDVEGINWYYQKYFKHYINSNHISVYMGERDNSLWLFLKMSYYGDDWLFFKQIQLSYDGNTILVPFDEYDDYESDSGNGGYVWEWVQVQITDNLLHYLKEFAKSPNAKMRFSGKYTYTKNISKDERQGINDVLNAYELLRIEKK